MVSPRAARLLYLDTGLRLGFLVNKPMVSPRAARLLYPDTGLRLGFLVNKPTEQDGVTQTHVHACCAKVEQCEHILRHLSFYQVVIAQRLCNTSFLCSDLVYYLQRGAGRSDRTFS